MWQLIFLSLQQIAAMLVVFVMPLLHACVMVWSPAWLCKCQAS